MLIRAAEAGEIELKYLDEAGWCLESAVSSYSYSQIGQQKRMEQPLKKNRKRVSILGLWQPDKGFEYALAQGGFNSQSYIKVMDWVAQKTAHALAQTGRITLEIKDNGSLHTSLLSQQQWTRWQVYFFFLPTYCSEMNLIESEWLQLKTYEIAGQIFDNEYDLALAIIAGIGAHSSLGGYPIESFIFISA
ncbi:transposase [Pseudanabaena yagii]|uniref:transposase n=1 Tax=Pseudanabaena yagii TaxID=2661615 RepID=UPI001B7D1B22|nr:transposase [Pseudanabaena yagii]